MWQNKHLSLAIEAMVVIINFVTYPVLSYVLPLEYDFRRIFDT